MAGDYKDRDPRFNSGARRRHPRKERDTLTETEQKEHFDKLRSDWQQEKADKETERIQSLKEKP